MALQGKIPATVGTIDKNVCQYLGMFWCATFDQFESNCSVFVVQASLEAIANGFQAFCRSVLGQVDQDVAILYRVGLGKCGGLLY